MWRNVFCEVLVLLRLIRRPNFVVRILDSHPAFHEILPGVIVVVADGERPKWACFFCPGGCGNKFQLSLNPSKRPRWEVTLDWLNRPSIYPSVHQKNSCCAHFWIRKGHVEWCQDSGHHKTVIIAKI